MSDDVLKRALDALAAIGALKEGDGASLERQAEVQVDDSFPTYAWDFDTRHTDPYWCKVMAAWRQIASHEYLPGAMQWAAKHHPNRYHHVTSELPAEWDRLWDEGAPLDEFQAALDRWVAAHEELLGLFPVSRGQE